MRAGLRTLIRTGALAIALFGADVSPAKAQESSAPAAAVDTTYEVKLRDGSSLYGRIESRSDSGIVILTTTGIRMEIPASSIAEIRVARGRMVDGNYWLPDPNKTRLFFGPTARAIGNQQGYFGTFLVLLPFAAYGIGDRLTLSGGTPLLFARFDPIYIAPKFTIVQTSNAAVAVGVMSVFGSDIEGFGVAFGMGTFGSLDNAFTAGIGLGYSGDDIGGQPAFMIGGETRTGRTTKLITENYFVAGGQGALLSGGVRLIRERLSVDVGMGGAAGGGEGFCCMPIVNFAFTFGK